MSDLKKFLTSPKGHFGIHEGEVNRELIHISALRRRFKSLFARGECVSARFTSCSFREDGGGAGVVLRSAVKHFPARQTYCCCKADFVLRAMAKHAHWRFANRRTGKVVCCLSAVFGRGNRRHPPFQSDGWGSSIRELLLTREMSNQRGSDLRGLSKSYPRVES